MRVGRRRAADDGCYLDPDEGFNGLHHGVEVHDFTLGGDGCFACASIQQCTLSGR